MQTQIVDEATEELGLTEERATGLKPKESSSEGREMIEAYRRDWSLDC